jgi:CheY-like chemotaxis protein
MMWDGQSAGSMIIAISIAVIAAISGAVLVALGVVAQRRRGRAAAHDEPIEPPRRSSAEAFYQQVEAELTTPRPITEELPPPGPMISGPLPVEQLRLLIVDDDVQAGRMVARVMRGHDTTVVTSGSAALTLLASDDKFDAILCALTMMGMSGVGFAANLAERHIELRSRLVFLVSGGATSQTQRLLALSDVRWVTKPVQYAQLAICVSEVVDAARRDQAERAPAQPTSAAS